MIRFENRHYRIEECHSTPLPFAVDHKEPAGDHVCLVNVGWYRDYYSAVRAMNCHAFPELRSGPQPLPYADHTPITNL